MTARKQNRTPWCFQDSQRFCLELSHCDKVLGWLGKNENARRPDEPTVDRWWAPYICSPSFRKEQWTCSVLMMVGTLRLFQAETEIVLLTVTMCLFPWTSLLPFQDLTHACTVACDELGFPKNDKARSSSFWNTIFLATLLLVVTFCSWWCVFFLSTVEGHSASDSSTNTHSFGFRVFMLHDRTQSPVMNLTFQRTTKLVGLHFWNKLINCRIVTLCSWWCVRLRLQCFWQ